MSKLEKRLKEVKRLTHDKRSRRLSTKYSYIDYGTVIELLKSGLKLPQVAEIYNCSVQTLRYQIKIDYPEFNAREYVRWGKTEVSDKQIAKLYEKLKSSGKVAEVVNMSLGGIVRRLKKLDIERQPKVREDITPELVARLYSQHGTINAVKEILKTTAPVVKSRLNVS